MGLRPSHRSAARRRRRTRPASAAWELPLGLMRLEERRVLTVNAMLTGPAFDVLEVHLEGAGESATITVNDTDEIEIRDSHGDLVLIDGDDSAPDADVNLLRVTGDGAADQTVLIESTIGHDLDLSRGGEVTGVEDFSLDATLIAGDLIDIHAGGEVSVELGARLEVNGPLASSPALHVVSGQTRLQGDVFASGEVLVESDGDVQVSSRLEGLSVVELLADHDNNDSGGVWITGTGRVVADQLLLEGADVSSTVAIDGVRIDAANVSGDVSVEAHSVRMVTSLGDVRIDGVVEGDALAESASDVVLGPNGRIVGPTTLRADGADGRISMHIASSIDAGNGQALLEAPGEIRVSLISSDNAGDNAIVLLAGGEIVDSNSLSLNLSAPQGGVVLQADRVASSTVPLEIRARTLQITASGSAFVHSTDDLELSLALAGDLLDISSDGSLTVPATSVVSAELIDLQADGQLEVAGQLTAFDLSVTSGADALLDGLIQAETTLSVQAGGDLQSSGQLIGGTVLLDAKGDALVGGDVDAAGLADFVVDGDLTFTGQLDADEVTSASGGDTSVTGQVTADQSILLVADGSLTIQPAGTLVADEVAIDAGQDLVVEGAAAAMSFLELTAAGDVRVIGETTGAETLIDAFGDGVLAGSITAADLLRVIVSGDLSADGTFDAGLADIDVDGRADFGGDLAASQLELTADGIDYSGEAAVEGLADVRSTSDLTMELGGVLAADQVRIETLGDATLGQLVVSGTGDDAVRVTSTGGAILDAGALVAILAPAGGAVLDAAAGIGGSIGLATDLDTLELDNRVSGDVLILDRGAVTLTRALQQAPGDLTIVADQQLTVAAGGTTVESLAGEANLISDNLDVDVQGGVRGGARVVVSAGRDVRLGPGGTLQSDTGNIGVLAGEAGTMGRLIMDPAATITSGSGQIAARGVGDLIVSGLSTGFSGGAVRLESRGGAIIDAGDQHLDIVTPGGVQLIAAMGVGRGDPLDTAIGTLTGFGDLGLELSNQGALEIGEVGLIERLSFTGDVTIVASGPITVTAPAETAGDLTLISGDSLIVEDQLAAFDGDLTLRAGKQLSVRDAGPVAEIQTTGSGIVILDAGVDLDFAPGAEVATETGRFQVLPLVVGETLMLEIVDSGGGQPLDADGQGTIRLQLGVPGDDNYLADILWSDGASEQVTGLPGGESLLTHQFDRDASGFHVTVTVGLDPRVGAGGVVQEGVRLFVAGEQLRPTVSASREAFGLGVDAPVVILESEVEPIEERPRTPEPVFILTTSSRVDVDSSLDIIRTATYDEVTTVERVFLRVVDDSRNRELPTEHPLRIEDLQDLTGVPVRYRLHDGHFRIYLQEAGTNRVRLLLDFHWIDGKIVPANYREGASERPPEETAPSKDEAEKDDGGAGGENPDATDADARPDAEAIEPGDSSAERSGPAAAAAAGVFAAARRRLATPPPLSRAARLARRVTGARTIGERFPSRPSEQA